MLIPSPNVAENHQYHNALELQKAGAALVFEEKNLTGQDLIATVDALTKEPGKLEKMGTAAQGLAHPEALQLILDDLSRLLDASK